MSPRAAALDLRARFLPDPCLWCWEIVDRHRADAPVHSSWAGEWTAFPSQEEALSAGRARLAAQRAVDSGRPGGGGRGKRENAA